MSKTTTIFYQSPSVKQQLYNPMSMFKDLLSQLTIQLEIKENVFL
jgi:hypothetical protein